MKAYLPLKIITLFTIIILISVTSGQTQEVEFYEEFADEPTKVKLVGFNFNVLYPTGTFKRNLSDKKGFGAGMFLLWQVDAMSPHFLGFDIEYDHLYDDVAQFNGLEERVNSGYISVNFNWRIFPDIKLWVFEPYLEAFVGPNFIFTSTNVVDETGQSVDFSFDKTNVGFEYGIGAGFTIPIAKTWFADIQFIRSQTSIAQYLILPTPSGDFSEVNSAIDHTKIKLGFIFAF